MDIQVRVDRPSGLRLQKVTGKVTLQELRSALTAIYEEGDETREMDSLWDLSEAEIGLSTEEVKHLSTFVGSQWGRRGGARSALVVSEDLAFGLARMYGTHLSEEIRDLTRVFKDKDAALAWLKDGPDPGGSDDG